MAKGSCPFTTGHATVEYEDGTIIEKDPKKDDNVFYLDEPLGYKINYNNNETHTKRPLKGVAVTVYDPAKKSVVLTTNSEGTIDFPFTVAGKYYLSYFDAFQKRTIIIQFNVATAEAKPTKPPIPVVTPPVVTPTPKPINATVPIVAPVKPQGSDFTVETGPKSKNWLKALIDAILKAFKRK